MLTKKQIAGILRDHQPYFAKRFGLKRIGLFGSYARGTQNERSEINLLAEFERPIGLKFIEFAEYIESLFSKKAAVI